ncbi:MAG: hypothetical protein COU90_02465 [Candidatus Ryanbacteria bacterium CG10_big_fil_rev_8_21_14_0_10_43_42]|uniref:Peptidase MA-like domain-containing protein n=1 Tax=Candidatus Ryanbacteria bacterium CG10_big_fil_rev_8_21_14_0_10_43_42 TaxID=1974864 RepID=A0A2M8KWJ5_9BACT|nr:MAG: hypothetical protein COU90_02465 [Candidatus Ryanbacteria bacterium CG10_big_fil_rev_8_21_14_0_10_43_42]
MNFKQHLPHYRDAFKNDSRWLRFESKHYIFHYFPESLAEKDITAIANRQEKVYKKIIIFLDGDYPAQKISYYLYPSEEIKKSLMGDDGFAQSIYNDFIIHALYTSEVQFIGEHEDMHLLSLPWGLSISLFQEGLAEYMVGYDFRGLDHDVCSKKAIDNKALLMPSQLMDQESWLNTSDDLMFEYYCIAGSFTGYLIDNYGKDVFKDLYMKTSRDFTSAENAGVFKQVYDKTIQEGEIDWLEHVRKS